MPGHLDQQLFLFLNSLHSPFWDKVMWGISEIYIWIPLYLAIIVALAIKYRRKFLMLILVIIIAVTLSDQLSVIIKNSVHRLRPSHEPSLSGLVHIVHDYRGGLYGFVSSHASNCFMVAVMSLLLIRKRWFTISILFWAMVVSYSRIYLGVHYPGDVLFGSLLGILVGWSIFKLYTLIDLKFLSGSKYFSSE
jgi:undecaprenyl-diphosphatase